MSNRQEELDRILSTVFDKKSFVDDVERFRQKVEIPREGFTTFREYYKYLEKCLEDKKHFFLDIINEAQRLVVKNELPQNYVVPFEGFIALDFNYKNFQDDLPHGFDRGIFVTDAYCALDIHLKFEEPFVSLKLYPGATHRGVEDSLKYWWPFIESMLEVKKELGNVKPRRTRVTHNQERNSEIYQLYLEGEIDNTGSWLPGVNLENYGDKAVERPACLKNLTTDGIKKIILREKRVHGLRERHSKGE